MGTVSVPVNPEFDDDPVITILPKVTLTDPTSRTTSWMEQLPVGLVKVQYPVVPAEVNVASSMDMLDWAAMFCWLCCPPAADDVCARNP